MNITNLHKLFNESGIKGRPITDEELSQLKAELEELARYMCWRGDSTMEASLRMEAQSVFRMIEARKN